jgi:phosphohistidine phosphatase
VKTVYLLRHAKSAWNNPDTEDHDRALNARGRAACTALARHMVAAKITPQLVLVSSAVRARETWERIAQELVQPFPVRELASLYLAEPRTMRKLIRGLDDKLASVMLVGHNPGFEELAHNLAAAGAPLALKRMAEKFPTGGLATLVFATDRWQAVARDIGRLADFVTPTGLGAD